MPDDDDAMTFDTRPGAARPPRRRRPQDESRAMPTRGGADAAVRRPMPRANSDHDPDRTQAMPQRPRRPASPQPGPDATQRMPVGGGRRTPDATEQFGAQRRPIPGGRPPVGGPPNRGNGNGGGRGPGDGNSRDPYPAPARPRRKRRWLRWVMIPLVIIALWLGALVWAANSAWNKVDKVDALPTGDRPASGKGKNYVLVGSDSRAGLSSDEAKNLGTGGSNIEGKRTDSIMIMHMGSNGNTLVSVPRDSWVEVPGHRKNKVNASYAIGGPKLLVATLEKATGLRIDGYLEIGFGGFAGVVDSVGGVRMCLDKPMKDKQAHIDLPAGCQTLDGKNALGYVRARYSDPLGDFGRIKRQREFLSALMNKVASPSNVLVPWKLKGVGESGAQGLAVDKDMGPITALRLAWALKSVTSSGQSVQVPVSNPALPTYAGEAVEWDAKKAGDLFTALREDKTPNVQP